MAIKIITCEQNSPEWHAARLGIPTASRFDEVLAEGKGSAPSKTRRTYMLKLMGEKLTGEQMYDYQNSHMERGHTMEDDARRLYVFAKDVEVQRVGFVRNEFTANLVAGCSPDSLIEDDGMLEIKTKLAHLQLEVLLSDELPPAHKAQVQGQLWVAEREWVDFCSYWPKLPPFIKRVYRDDVYIKHLAKGVEIFCNEMHTLLKANFPKETAA